MNFALLFKKILLYKFLMIPQENYQPDVPNNIFEQMMYAYNEHKIDEAFRLALAFEEMCFKTKVKPTP